MAIDAEQLRACLPRQADEPAWVIHREVGDVLIGISGMQLGGIISVLCPGGGHRQIILLEDVLPVPQAHGSDILRDGVDRIAQGHLVPSPGRKMILHRIRPVLRQVNKRPRRLKGRHILILDHANIGLIIGLDGRKQLVIFSLACPHIDHINMDVGVGTVPERG